MKRLITPEDVEWAYLKYCEMLELVARQLAQAGEPELAARLREER